MHRQSQTRATAIVTGLFLSGLFVGALAGQAAVARAGDRYASLDLFARVLTTIERDFVDDVSTDQLIDAAIEGMVSELDDQSRWLSAREFRALQDDTEGATTGIGVEVRGVDDGVLIVRVLPGSPAGRDGLAEGDRILEIDGASIIGLGLDEVRDRFQGERGEQAVLTVAREGWDEPVEIRTVRDRVLRPSVEAHQFDDVAYVRLVQFQDRSAFDIQSHVERVAADAGGVDALSGLVLDLRDNPGGLLTEAVAVCDLFLDEGVIVSTRGRHDAVTADEGAAESHSATPGGFPPELRVVILINGMSASASEIVAGAMQDTGRGVLVGDATYGKGTVQKVYKHLRPEEAALKLTVGRYYTPSGAPVAPREGRVPDVVVPMPTLPTASQTLRERLGGLELEAADRDELLVLVDAIPEGEAVPTAIEWDVPVADRLADDPQLQEALRIAATDG